MSEKMKCPCCEKTLEQNADSCSDCGITELNQIFLNQRDYEKWKKEVLMPYKSAWKKRLLELEEQKKREEQISQIIGGSRHVLILTADHRLYGLGSNDGGQLGNDNIGNVESPQLLAENVCSAAVMSEPFYTIYVTEHGSVKLIGNGEYADRFGGFENAREVFTQAGVFWIQDLRGKWFGFGDNSNEQIAKRTKECICEIADEPFEQKFTATNFSTAPPSREEYEKGHCSVSYSSICHLNERISQLNSEYGKENISLDLDYHITQSEYSGYSYVKKGIYSARITLINKHIYIPVEFPFKMSKASEETVSFTEPFTLISFYENYLFGLKKTGELCVERQNFEFLDDGVKALGNGTPALTKVKDFKLFEPDGNHAYILLSMKDGSLFYGKLEDFCQTWDVNCLKTFWV